MYSYTVVKSTFTQAVYFEILIVLLEYFWYFISTTFQRYMFNFLL